MKMGKKPNLYTKALSILQILHKDYPNQTLGQHLSGALGEYKDLWSIPDKEVVFALERYQLEKDNNIISDADVDKIYREGLNLNTIFDDEDGYEEE